MSGPSRLESGRNRNESGGDSRERGFNQAGAGRKPKFLDQIRTFMHARRYSRRTEQAYVMALLSSSKAKSSVSAWEIHMRIARWAGFVMVLSLLLLTSLSPYAQQQG